MSEPWKYQIRFRLAEDRAQSARENPDGPAYQPIKEVLSRHDAVATTTYDAFVNYVAEAERHGVDRYPLYKWTKATIEDPIKRAKHLTSFAVYVDGEEVYDVANADALEADLRLLQENGLIVSVSKHDTNPESNPQAPAHLI